MFKGFCKFLMKKWAQLQREGDREEPLPRSLLNKSIDAPRGFSIAFEVETLVVQVLTKFNVSSLWVVVGIPIGQQFAISKTNFTEKS